MSVPKTVNMTTFRFTLASVVTIFIEAETYFRQRKNIVSLFQTSLFSTDVFLAHISA